MHGLRQIAPRIRHGASIGRTADAVFLLALKRAAYRCDAGTLLGEIDRDRHGLARLLDGIRIEDPHRVDHGGVVVVSFGRVRNSEFRGREGCLPCPAYQAERVLHIRVPLNVGTRAVTALVGQPDRRDVPAARTRVVRQDDVDGDDTRIQGRIGIRHGSICQPRNRGGSLHEIGVLLIPTSPTATYEAGT